MDPSRLRTTRSIANLRAGRNDWYKVIKAQAPGTATQVMVYDEIGWFGVTAQDFINDLKGVSGPVDLHLNSPGGDVFDGIAIFQFLAGRGDVTTYVDGLAASIASVIAMAGTEIVMGRNSSMMIHDGWGMVIGNAADMRDQADLLDRVSDNIASVYAERSGKPADEWRKLMLAESWFFGQEAVDAGLATRLADVAGRKQLGGDDDAAQQAMSAHFDLSVFRNVPEHLTGTTAQDRVQVEWTSPAAGGEVMADLRQNIRLCNHAADPAPPPTPSQPTDEAPDPPGRGFSLSGDAMDPTPPPGNAFRSWLADGLDLIGESVSAAAIRAADNGSHGPFTGTHNHTHPAYGDQGDDAGHEHKHSHDDDADHDHDHDHGDEESDGDGGMQNAGTGRILGIESMPLENKALPVHHTATVDEPWDGPAAVAAMPNDDAVLRYCHAWETDEAAAEPHEAGDDDADDQKASYKFPHHAKQGAAANLPACRNGLARLSGADIPDGDRAGVKAHLQAHLDDAGSGDDGNSASNHTHEHPTDAWSWWDPQQFTQAMEGA
jgi:ATP-dependent protease ClpP protease subunit